MAAACALKAWLKREKTEWKSLLFENGKLMCVYEYIYIYIYMIIYTYGTPFAHENVYIYAYIEYILGGTTGHGTVNVSADAIKCISTHMSYRRK